MKRNKKILYSISLSMMILIIVSLTGAVDWTQYTPSPTSDDVEKVRTYNQYAMALTDTDNILYYNGTNWAQINPPTDAVTIDRIDFDKATDGQFHWIIQNSSRWTQYYTYNPVNKIWGLNSEAQKSEIKSNAGLPYNYFACIHEDSGHNGISGDAECWLLLNNGSIIPYGDASSIPQTLSDPFAIVAGTVLGVQNDEGFATYTIRLYNGVGYSTTSSLDSIRDFYIDSASFFSVNYITGGTRTTASYNASTGAWITYPLGSTPAHAIAIEPSEARVYYTVDGSGLYEQSYFLTGTPDLVLNTTTFIRDIDFDVINKKGWLGGDSGFLAQNTVSTGGTVEIPETINYAISSYTSKNSTITNIVGVTPITTSKTYAVAKKDGDLAIISYDHTNPNSMIVENLSLGSGTPRGIDALGDTISLGASGNLRIFNNTDPEEVTELTLKATPQASTLYSDDILAVKYATANDIYGCDHRFTDEIVRYNATNGTVINSDTGVTCYDLESSSGGDYVYAHGGLDGLYVYPANLTAPITYDIIASVPSGKPTDLLSVLGSKLAVVTGRNVIKVYDITSPAVLAQEWECRASGDITSLEMLTSDIIVIGTTGSQDVVVDGKVVTNPAGTIQVCNQEDDSLYDSASNYYISKQVKANPASPDGIAQRDIRRLSGSLTFASAEASQFTYYQLQIGDLASVNLAPIITSTSVQDDTVCINQTVYGGMTAVEQDEGQILSLYYDCGDGEEQSSNVGFTGQQIVSGQTFCQYGSSGIKTITFKAKDFQAGSPNPLTTITSPKSISVGTCILGVDSFPINIRVSDIITGDPINNVLVNLIGETSAFTDSQGLVSFELSQAGAFNVTASKSGYLTTSRVVTTGNSIQNIQLESLTNEETGQPKSLLTVNVINQIGQPITEVLVSATDTISATAKTTSTDLNGQAFITDLPAGVIIRVSAGKTGYLSEFQELTMDFAGQKTITMSLRRDGELRNSGRGCVDHIAGLVLCSPLNISGNGDSCLQDSDCITANCQMGFTDDPVGTCSNFNYSVCDVQGIPRDGICVNNALLKTGSKNLINSIFNNFLIVLIIICFIFIYLMFKKSDNGR